MKYAICPMMIALILVGVASGSETPVLVRDWKQLEKAFEDLQCGPVLPELLATDEFRSLFEQGEQRIFLEMTAQHGMPLVRLAGFLALRDKKEPTAVASAIWLVVGTDPIPQQWLLPAYEFLMEEAQSNAVVEGLFAMVGSPQHARPRTAVLIGVLPIKLISRMANDQRFGGVDATFAALVLDRLIAENVIKSQLVAETLRRFAVASGVPRQVYLLHTKDRDEIFRRALVLFLEDVNISNMQLTMVVSRLKDEVAALDLERLSTDPPRRNHIRTLLEAPK